MAPADGDQQDPAPTDEAWRAVPYNRASEGDLKSLARAYAETKGVKSVTSEDIRRDFAVTGRLVDHFGSMRLGSIVQAAQRCAAEASAPAQDVESDAGPCSTPSAA